MAYILPKQVIHLAEHITSEWIFGKRHMEVWHYGKICLNIINIIKGSANDSIGVDEHEVTTDMLANTGLDNT